MKPYEALADLFARSLVNCQFDGAHQMLAHALRPDNSPEALKRKLEEMLEYAEGPITLVEVTNTLDDWPEKKPGDVGWAYVGMSGDTFAEAVSVVVVQEDGDLRIREIEWGRP